MEERIKVTRRIEVDDARLIFKNFRGEKDEFNVDGKRTFGLILPDDLAADMDEEGWPIKYLRPKPDDSEQHATPWINVRVRFDQYPPDIHLIVTRNGQKRKMAIDERTVDQLDWSRLEEVDVIISPYNYPATSLRPAGVSAYLRTMWATVSANRLDEKYANIPDLDDEELPFGEEE